MPGHVTCSAAVINSAGQILHIHHNVLQKWLLPGGHCETNDTTLVEAALREVQEETGIEPDRLTEWDSYGGSVIDINLHPIAANPNKGESAHWHADFRYVYRLTTDVDITLQAEEVSKFTWLEPAQLAPSQLTTRLIPLFETS
jgi:8-oxo-dGTP pyrophosphatase MutT (NUDIX family)